LSAANAKLVARYFEVLKNPHKIAVYKTRDIGNWVKHFFAENEPLETPNADGVVTWFDDDDEALKFWRIKEGIEPN
jgi:hypothetical protein